LKQVSNRQIRALISDLNFYKIFKNLLNTISFSSQHEKRSELYPTLY